LPFELRNFFLNPKKLRDGNHEEFSLDENVEHFPAILKILMDHMEQDLDFYVTWPGLAALHIQISAPKLSHMIRDLGGVVRKL
jgi:hypothetical protein